LGTPYFCLDRTVLGKKEELPKEEYRFQADP